MPDANVEIIELPPTSGVDAPPRFWSVPDLAGENYRVVLERFHSWFSPATYLEIGVNDGSTLELAHCDAIAIDPVFRLTKPLEVNKPSCCFYRKTSDAFFATHNPTVIFGRPIEMAFLDGMHWFEFLLRDFFNTEQHCRRNSVIFMHDCMPVDEHVGRRSSGDATVKKSSRHKEWWAGDVWKVVALLQHYRPDLKVYAFDAVPTGLIAVTNLDPESRFLQDNYFDIVTEYRDKSLRSAGQAYLNNLEKLETRQYASYNALSTLFWL